MAEVMNNRRPIAAATGLGCHYEKNEGCAATGQGDAAMAAAAGGRTQVTVVVVVGGEGVGRRRGDRSIRDELDEGHRESPSSHRLAFDVAQL